MRDRSAGIFAKQRFIVLSLSLLVFGLAAYVQTVFFPFVHDDLVFIRDNPDISRLGNWPEHLTRFAAAVPGISIANPFYRPLLELLYRLQYRLFHFDAGYYHLFNVILHIINSWFMFVFFRRLLCRKAPGAAQQGEGWRPGPGCDGIAWITAVIFLVHPAQTEAVACVAGVSNVLLVFLCMAAFLLYFKAADAASPRLSFGLFIAGAFLYVMALLIKEQAVVLPVLVLAYEGTVNRGRRASPSRAYGALTGLFALTAGYFLWRHFFLGGAMVPLWSYPRELWLRVLAIPRTLLTDLGILVFPFGLHYYRSLDILAANGPAAAVLALIMLVLVFLYRTLPAEVRRHVLFGGLWFFITLGPMLNIVPLIHEYAMIAIFEHFLYWPLAGFFYASVCSAVYGISRSGVQIPVRFWGAASLGLAVVLTGMTARQTRYWRGEIPLFERMAAYEPGLARGQILLAEAYVKKERYAQALKPFLRAQEILQRYLDEVEDPSARNVYTMYLTGAFLGAGQCYDRLGQADQAVQYYQAALHLEPNNSMILNILGVACLRLNEIDRAEQVFSAAVSHDRDDLPAKSNLAYCLLVKGEKVRAKSLLAEILAVDPDFAPARRNWEALLRETQSAPSAENAGP